MANTDNPYQTPSAAVLEPSALGDEWEFSEPRSVPTGHGWRWIVDGFRLFSQNPGTWIGIYLVFMVITMLLSMLPLVSIAATILSPILLGGMLLGAREQDKGNPLQFNHLFAGFSEAGGNLALVGVFMLVATMVITVVTMIIYFAIFGGTLFNGGLNPQANPDQAGLFFIQSFGVITILVLLLVTPVLMAYFFAPGLIALHRQEFFDSLKYSFLGCWRNMLPLSWFGLLVILMFIVGAIPLGLGWLVVGPVTIAAGYTAYKDIFTLATDTD
jgi:uncharacterized membrane protein